MGIKVKALDPETEIVETYDCVPCPQCGKWIVVNESHKFCSYCGTQLDWEALKKYNLIDSAKKTFNSWSKWKQETAITAMQPYTDGE